MPNSHADHALLTCPNCAQSYEADVWLIVDTAERPDLLEQLQAETLHALVCPHCAHQATLDAALLIHRPDADPALIFSPARQTDASDNREQAQALVSMLRAEMADEWQEAWLSDGLPGVPRSALGALLRDEPEAVARLQAARANAPSDDIPPAMAQALEEVLTMLASDGVRVQTAADLDRALDDRPQLRARLMAAQEEVLAEAMPSLRQAMDTIMETLAAEGTQVSSPEELEQILSERADLRAILEQAGGGLPGQPL